MSENVYLVTGANSGVGFGTVLGLAEQGHRVVMLCRSQERGEAARQTIIQRSGSQSVDLLLCDLASQAAIRQAAADFTARYDRLDGLINNAAVVPRERGVTEDGIELQLAVNHLAPFLLTHLLIDPLLAAPAARVVNLSALPDKRLKPRFEDFQSEHHYHIWGWRVYHHTKIMLLLFTAGLGQRLAGTNVTAYGAHPGVVNSGIIKVGGVLRWIMSTFFRTPEQGAKSVIYAATDPSLAGKTGLYIDWNSRSRPIGDFYRQADIDHLWQLSQDLTGVENLLPG